jgi:P4 family phage/plasmid primase-like protien
MHNINTSSMNKYDKLVERSVINIDPKHIANIIGLYHKDRVVCIKKSIWYKFIDDKSKWCSISEDDLNILDDNITEIYQYYAKKYIELRGSDPESGEYYKYDKYYLNCYKIIVKLRESPFIDKVMKECRKIFYDVEFIHKLNTNLNLVGMSNCIIDLQYPNKNGTNIMFRKGIPEDYMSNSIGYGLPIDTCKLPISLDDVIKEMSNGIIKEIFNDELNYQLNEFIHKILPYEDVREYTLRFLSSCLSGEVMEHKFYMWTGSGGNGKSLLVKLLQHTLGDYSKTMDVSYITKERGGSSNASPELEAIKHARFVSLSEPERHDSIYVGKLKQITGGDTMTSRGLFKDTYEFKPQFKMMLMCNNLPSIPNVDGGIARRIEVVDFPSKFTDNPRPTTNNPLQYLADKTLNTKLKQWNIVFLFKLLEYYTKFIEEGTKAPPSVTEATQIYFIENDLIKKWIKEDLTECEDTKSFNTLYQTFAAWCENEGINSKKVEKRDIKKSLEEEQIKSTYGLEYGKKASDKAPNGCPKFPQFNFCSKDDLDDFDD